MIPFGLALPALFCLSAVAAVVLIHALYDLSRGSKHDDEPGE